VLKSDQPFGIKEVGYLTGSPARAYAIGLRRARSLKELQAYLSKWEGLVDDALGVVKKWRSSDFKEWLKVCDEETRGNYTGDANADKYGAVLMPELMFKADVLAIEFNCPWGTAVMRLRNKEPKP
jgi:hypothetical protein